MQNGRLAAIEDVGCAVAGVATDAVKPITRDAIDIDGLPHHGLTGVLRESKRRDGPPFAMATDNRIERTIGLVMLAVLAIGCVLVLRPFFTAVCVALILVVATWPAFDHLQRLLGGQRTLAALLMVTLATLVFVLPPALVAFTMDYNVAGTIRLLSDLSQRGLPTPPAWSPGSTLSVRRSTLAGGPWRPEDPRQQAASTRSSSGSGNT